MVSETSVELTGLSASTSYTFTAYSDGGCTNSIQSINFTTDAPPRAVNLSTESLTLTEGSTATYTVVLNSEPTGTVTIALASSDTMVATISPVSLSFTTSSWDQAQTVTVTGLDNDIVGSMGAITISHKASGGGYDAVADVTLEVSVSDDDVRGVSLSPESLTLTEGATGTYTVVLDSEPTGTVTVALGSSDTTVATVSPASLSFTISNWEQAQSVTVTGVDDDVDGQDGAITISHKAAGGGYDAVADVALAVSVSDDDVRGISLSPESLTLTEGATGTYTVVLDSEPTGTVTVALGSSDTTVATVSPASLSFTISNWEQAQSVTVMGVNDEIVNNPLRTATISHNTSGGDYDSVAVAAVSVTLNDDDTVRQEDKAAQKVDNAVLAQVVEQTAGATITAITNRVSSIAAGAVSGGIPINPSTPTGNSVSLLEGVTTDAVEFLWANQGAIQSGEWSLQQALAGRRFSMPLSVLIRSQAHNAQDALVTAKDDGSRSPRDSGSTGASTLALWGSADYSAYANLLDGVDLDGNSILFALGMDLQPTANLVTGLAVAFNSSTFGYSYKEDVDAQSGTAEETKGTYEVNITTVNPYVSWSVSEQLDLWASVGYGRGERHLKPKDGATTSKQSDWISLAGGARLQLWRGGSVADRSTDRATAAMQPGTAAALDGGADHNMAPGSGTAASPLTLSLKLEGATAQFMGVDVQQARLLPKHNDVSPWTTECSPRRWNWACASAAKKLPPWNWGDISLGYTSKPACPPRSMVASCSPVVRAMRNGALVVASATNPATAAKASTLFWSLPSVTPVPAWLISGCSMVPILPYATTRRQKRSYGES